MATINIGRLKPVFQGAYDNAQGYVVDDIVTYSGETYICILASTGNVPTNTTYWSKMASKGADGVDADLFSIASTAQGDIYYNNGSAIARLGAGSVGQALITNGTGANPSWGTISSGTYSVHAIDSYNYQTSVTSPSSNQEYLDIAGGNTVSFQPTSTNDFVFLSHTCRTIQGGNDYGLDVYLMMKEGSSAIGSGDTRLNYDGNYSFYTESRQDGVIGKNFILSCSGLNTSSTYYIEQAGANHNTNACGFNTSATNASGDYRTHNVSLIHYKAN